MILFTIITFLLIISDPVLTDKSLPQNNKKGSGPGGGSAPLQVSFRLFVNTVSPIVSSDMEYKIAIRLVMEWSDPRIAEEFECTDASDFPITLSPQKVKEIWLPDLFFENAKSAGTKSFVKPLVEVKLMSTGGGDSDDGDHDGETLKSVVPGLLQLTMIANATVACNMDFHFYPMDIQRCPLFIRSFQYSSEELQFNWANENDDFKSFVVKPRRLIQFEVVQSPILPFATTTWFPNQGNFSLLVATFQFERLVGSHLVQTFIPSSLVVTLSWCSFWLELDVTSARGSLLMTSMLTLVTHLSGLRAELPPVAYVKTVDFWIFGCMFSIFLALVEFAIVKAVYSLTEEQRSNNLVKKLNLELNEPCNNDKPQKKRLGSVVLSGRSVATEEMPLMNIPFGCFHLPLVWNSKGNRVVLWRKFDEVSRWLFPLIFGIFSAAYWTVLISHHYIYAA